MTLYILYILRKILQIYMFVLVLAAILSWVDVIPMKYEARQKVYKVRALLMKIIIPFTDKIDRFVKPVRFGNINLSLSFVLLFFVIMLLDNVLIKIAWEIYLRSV